MKSKNTVKKAKKVTENNLGIRQLLGLISLLAIIANILCRFAFRIYGDAIFWVVLIIVAIIAWPVMNWLRK